MRKIILLLVVTAALTGCVGTMENPYKNIPNAQMGFIKNSELCKVATRRAYKPSQNVYDEVARRDLGECSDGELYCANLGLKRGSKTYADCRLRYDETQLQAIAIQNAEQNAREQQKIQKQAVQAMYNLNRGSSLPLPAANY